MSSGVLCTEKVSIYAHTELPVGAVSIYTYLLTNMSVSFYTNFEVEGRGFLLEYSASIGKTLVMKLFT